MRIIFTCGGSGGHIYPAIAVAQLFRRQTKNCDILFVGADGAMETQLVPREGFEIKTLPVSNLAHSLSLKAVKKNIKSMSQLMGSLRQAGKVIKSFRPDIVIGTGGYACFPVLFKASQAGIPTLMHESNVTPGLTTRMLARRVTRMMTGFSGVAAQYPVPERVINTGTPVRETFLSTDPTASRKALGLDHRPVVAASFGSLGARDMSRMMTELLRRAATQPGAQYLYATGKRYYADVMTALETDGITPASHPHIHVSEFFFDMPAVLASTDVYIGRAGASTLNELMVTGTPAILIPSPNVTNDHQTANALKLHEDTGICVLAEKDLTTESLERQLGELLRDGGRRLDIRRRLLRAAVPDAAQRIYELAVNVAGRSTDMVSGKGFKSE